MRFAASLTLIYTSSCCGSIASCLLTREVVWTTLDDYTSGGPPSVISSGAPLTRFRRLKNVPAHQIHRICRWATHRSGDLSSRLLIVIPWRHDLAFRRSWQPAARVIQEVEGASILSA